MALAPNYYNILILDPLYFWPASMLLNGTGDPPKSPTMPIPPATR